jgi:hypothetical protein
MSEGKVDTYGASRFPINLQLICAGLPQVLESGLQRHLPLADVIGGSAAA